MARTRGGALAPKKRRKRTLTFSAMRSRRAFVQSAKSTSFPRFPQWDGGKLIKNVENSGANTKYPAVSTDAKIKLLTFSTVGRWKTQNSKLCYFLRFAYLTGKDGKKESFPKAFSEKKTIFFADLPRFFILFLARAKKRRNSIRRMAYMREILRPDAQKRGLRRACREGGGAHKGCI